MLTKQSLDISFAQGLDTKTDPWQTAPDTFLALTNSVFTTGKRLTKRNGNQQLATLSGTYAAYLSTFNDNLTAIGQSVYAYNEPDNQWVTRGTIRPMDVTTLPLIRNNINQTQVDAAVAPNGLVCTVYTQTNGGTTTYRYAIANSVTGQNIVAPAAIPVSSGTVSAPRVFVLGNNFIIVFTNLITATNHLQYVAISITNPTSVTANTDIASAYVPASTVSWDGLVVGNNLYVAYNNTAGGQSVKVTYLSAYLGAVVTPTTFAGRTATMMTLAADLTNSSGAQIYVSFYDLASTSGYTASVDVNLNVIFAPHQIISTGTVLNIASAAQNSVVLVFYEVDNAYSYDAAIKTNLIKGTSVNSAGTTLLSPYNVVRGVGLASKAFLANATQTDSVYNTFASFPQAGAVPVGALALDSSNGILYRSSGSTWVSFQTIYFLAAYSSPYQPTYFLINGSTSTQSSPVVVAKLAYENGGGYLTLGLPSVTITNGNVAQFAYRFKDLISPVNKGTALAAGTQVAGVYSQTGLNLATIAFTTDHIDTAEIASTLNISGGFLWMYDGYLPAEQNFFLWPDSIEAVWAATGGSIAAKPDGSTNTNAYYYQVTYEWTDNQGNAHRSAPSIPVAVTTTGSGVIGSITVSIPMLRLTYKIANPVKIVVYRWSVGQPVYYQTTSISAAQLNDTTADSLDFVDTNADATILGNNIIYTNGGVVENVNAPASNILTLFDNRLWLVDAEDKNLLWFSKQVIEATPVEMSDLLTKYVAPTQGAQGSTGPITALAPMDDKIIIFKENAIYYINGTGPNNTGASDEYSEPIFVTATVGCANQRSLVFQPSGVMFQSNKGIWLLGRDLSTSYIGAAVEGFNAGLVNSAVNVPETNQVRFTLSTGQTLMYDYYYSQWGEFTGVSAVSSCIFSGVHAYLNRFGDVFQETPGYYQDGSNPVLIGFTMSWLSLAGIQGYQRAYWFYLLGEYFTPHKLQVTIAYDFNPSPTQSSLITPTNFSQVFGGPDPNPADGTDGADPFGQETPFGGPGSVEQWRIFLTKQRCQSIQLSLQEIYDPSLGVPAGKGLTLSGIKLTFAGKKSFRPMSTRQTIGGGTA